MRKHKNRPKDSVYFETLGTGGELRYNMDTGKFYAEMLTKDFQWKEFDDKAEAHRWAVSSLETESFKL